MGAPPILLTALLLFLPGFSHCQLHTLIAPNVFRVESEETIILESHEYGSELKVDILLQDFPQKITLYTQTQVTLNAANNFLVETKMKISAYHIKRNPKQRQFVYLTAKSDAFTLEKVILISFESGFIFIQTDKPLYTPTDKVFYRLFAVNHQLTPSSSSVIVDLVNPYNIIVKRQVSDKSGIISSSFDIPGIDNMGIWKIVAMYENAQQKNFSTEFEVKEYVMPSTEVKVHSHQSFFHVDDNSLTVDITARDLHGKPVDGSAYILFGVKMDDEKISIPESLKRIPIENGGGAAVLTRAMITGKFPNINELLGHSIYVAVTVLTNAGSDMVEAEKTGIQIVKSPYKIVLTKTSKYFKPGFPCELMVYVTYPDGSPANRIPVVANPGGVRGMTHGEGTAKLAISTSSAVQDLQITVTTESPGVLPEHQATTTMTAQPYRTKDGSNNYLYISVTATEVTPGETINVFFILKNDPDIQDNIKYFTYVIMSRGKIVKVGRKAREVGQTVAIMSFIATAEFIPSFRVIGYYTVNTPRGREVVSDSVWVDMKDTCIGTLQVKPAEDRDKQIQEPGRRMRLKLIGDPGAMVGLVAVDKRAFVLSNKNKMTQARVWDVIEKNDIGCTPGGGADNMGVFRDAGLVFHCSDKISTTERLAPECPAQTKRNRRSAVLIQDKDERGAEEEDYMSEEDIVSRSLFFESWLWNVEMLPAVPNEKELSSKLVQLFLKDSITTWEVQAVSISPQKGICVAEPHEIIVMKDFFIDLHLPYSVVRNEQIEIKAIVYNYFPHEIMVRMQLIHNPHVCSVATANTKYFKDYTIPRESSISVPYVVVPMVSGEVEMEVKGSVKGKFVSDGVKKKLRVVAEGMKVAKTIKSVILDPVSKGKDGKQEEHIKAINLKNVVPNTEPEIVINVKGDVVEATENSIDGANLKHLIQVPYGSGEANMITITPAVISTHYLDKTNQWDRIGPDLRSEAIKHITQGYTQQMAYRQLSSAYAAFTNRPPSTWLTAYVVKVFSMAHQLIPIEPQVLCGAVKWLIAEKQKPNGIFKEDAPVIHSEMIGGFKGAEPDTTLTAFVVIALSEAREICHKLVGSLDDSITKANEYLKLHYEQLQRTYSIAIVSYALALNNQLNTHQTLMKASTDMNHWEDSASDQYTFEATAYSLLTLVKLQKFDLAGPVVRWITEKRFFGGGYGSTQSTIMILQAVAQYRSDVTDVKNFALNVAIHLPGRSRPVTIRINQDNAFLGRYERTKLNQDFKVEASGTGQGTLTVTTIYNEVVKEDHRKCKNFDLNVTVEVDEFAERPVGAFNTVFVTVCTRFLGETASTMTILDVSMLTGFLPDLNYLNQHKHGLDKNISNYEINKALADKGSLIIYVDKISNKRDQCLKIKANQIFKVGLLKPASVTVYEYYNIDNRCTKFYHPSKESGLLSRICLEDVCKCAEENCALLRKYDKAMTVLNRTNEACAPEYDYVYKLKLLGVNNSASYDYYRIEILEVIKKGSDHVEKGSQKTFITHSDCRETLSLHINKQYLVKGHTTDIWNLEKEVAYVIGKHTVIDWWPNDVECQDCQNHEICTDFHEFAKHILMFGCPI